MGGGRALSPMSYAQTEKNLHMNCKFSSRLVALLLYRLKSYLSEARLSRNQPILFFMLVRNPDVIGATLVGIKLCKISQIKRKKKLVTVSGTVKLRQGVNMRGKTSTFITIQYFYTVYLNKKKVFLNCVKVQEKNEVMTK